MAVVNRNSNSGGGSGGRSPFSIASLTNIMLGFILGYAVSHMINSNRNNTSKNKKETASLNPSTRTATIIPETATAKITLPLLTTTDSAGDETQSETTTETTNPPSSSSSSDPQTNNHDSKSTEQRNFYDIAVNTHTDKVTAKSRLPECLKHDNICTRPSCVRENCRPWGHFYHTMYQQRLGPWSTDDTEPFQFLEVGFYNGNGFEAYNEFLPKAEVHSMEISCIEAGPREEGKWPWGNFAANNKKWYDRLLKEERLHCGDANNVTWLDEIWRTKMNRPDAPPLKVVVDDGSHLASHMIQSFFFWFPRIEPGGLMIVEDIQPIQESNLFRTQFLPQIMSDLHYCGDPKQPKDEPCFPTLWPLLQSIHCEMHICVFERNSEPAQPNLDLAQSTRPKSAFELDSCLSLREPFGLKSQRR